MKKVVLLVGLSLVGLGFTSCNKEVKNLEDCGKKIEYLEFDGHEYVYMSYRGINPKNLGTMCHSPKCKCLEQYRK